MDYLCVQADSHGLTHISLASFFGASTNNVEPYQTLQNAASDQVLHCLLAECTFKI